MKRHVHLAVPIALAIEKLKMGVNLFNVKDEIAMKELLRRQKKGIEFISGCNKEDPTGICTGHKVK